MAIPLQAAILFVIFQSSLFAQTSAPAEPLELRFTTVPREVPAIQATLDELRGELQLLPATTQPAASQPATSQPTTQPVNDPAAQLQDSKFKLRAVLSDFEGQLRELLRLTQELDQAAVDEAAKKLTGQITAWRSRTEELKRADLPLSVDNQAIEEITADYVKANQQLDAFSTAKAQQDDLIRKGLRTQRDQNKNDLTVAGAAMAALEASFPTDLKAADGETSQELLIIRRRTAHARAALLDTLRVVLEMREKVTQLELERNRLRLEDCQKYVNALRDRKDALQQAKLQSSTEKLKKELKQLESSGNDPLQKLFKRLQLIREECVPKAQRDFENIRDRFGPRSLMALQADLETDTVYWKQLEVTLERLSATDVLEAYEEAEREQDRAAQEHRKKQAMLDKTFVEQRDLEETKRRELSRFDKIAATFQKQAGSSSDPEVLRMIQQIGPMRAELRAAFDDALKLDKVRDLLREAVDITRHRLELWQAASRKLYWYRLVTRAPSYFDSKVYSPVKEELRGLRGNQFSAILAQTRDLLIFQVQSLQSVDWGIILTVELAVMAILLGIIRRSRNYLRGKKPLSENPESLTIPFLDRLRPRVAKAALVLVPVVSVAIFAAMFVLSSGMEQSPQWLGYVLCGLWAGASLIPALLYVAFHASKPRYRVVPCSSVVARHYVRLGYLILCFGIGFLAPACILWGLDLAPVTADLLDQAFQFFATLAVLVFLLRRDVVLNVVPRTERGRFAGTMTALQTIYPLIVLLLIALVLLRFTGFAAMAGYVTVGLAGTLGAILAAWVTYLFIRETVVWMVYHTRKTREAYAPPPPPPIPAQDNIAEIGSGIIRPVSTNVAAPYQPSLEDEADDRDPGVPATAATSEQLPGSARLTLSTLRWVSGACAIFLALYAWGLRPYEVKRLLDVRLWEHGGQEVTLWRIGGALLAILIATFISRGIRQTLRSRLYPAHPGLDVGVQAAIDTLLHYIITLIGIYVALQTLRLDFGALAVLFGGLGLGLGLGLQPLIVNFTSGLIMLFERQVKVGDVINLGDKQGEVVRISMRSTIVRTADGMHIILPNGDFINQKVENWTLGHQPVRGGLDIVVSYHSDPERIRSILLEIARHEKLAMRYPPAEVFFKDMNESGMNFSIAAWYRNMAERGAGLLNMRYAIADRFAREGIEIPVKALAAMKPGKKTPSGS